MRRGVRTTDNTSLRLFGVEPTPLGPAPPTAAYAPAPPMQSQAAAYNPNAVVSADGIARMESDTGYQPSEAETVAYGARQPATAPYQLPLPTSTYNGLSGAFSGIGPTSGNGAAPYALPPIAPGAQPQQRPGGVTPVYVPPLAGMQAPASSDAAAAAAGAFAALSRANNDALAREMAFLAKEQDLQRERDRERARADAAEREHARAAEVDRLRSENALRERERERARDAESAGRQREREALLLRELEQSHAAVQELRSAVRLEGEQRRAAEAQLGALTAALTTQQEAANAARQHFDATMATMAARMRELEGVVQVDARVQAEAARARDATQRNEIDTLRRWVGEVQGQLESRATAGADEIRAVVRENQRLRAELAGLNETVAGVANAVASGSGGARSAVDERDLRQLASKVRTLEDAAKHMALYQAAQQAVTPENEWIRTFLAESQLQQQRAMEARADELRQSIARVEASAARSEAAVREEIAAVSDRAAGQTRALQERVDVTGQQLRTVLTQAHAELSKVLAEGVTAARDETEGVRRMAVEGISALHAGQRAAGEAAVEAHGKVVARVNALAARCGEAEGHASELESVLRAEIENRLAMARKTQRWNAEAHAQSAERGHLLAARVADAEDRAAQAEVAVCLENMVALVAEADDDTDKGHLLDHIQRHDFSIATVQTSVAKAAVEARDVARSVAAQWAERDARALREAEAARTSAEDVQRQREVRLTMDAMLTALDLAEQDEHLARTTNALMEHIGASLQDALAYSDGVAVREARKTEANMRGVVRDVERRFRAVLDAKETEAAVRDTLDDMIGKIENSEAKGAGMDEIMARLSAAETLVAADTAATVARIAVVESQLAKQGKETKAATAKLNRAVEDLTTHLHGDEAEAQRTAQALVQEQLALELEQVQEAVEDLRQRVGPTAASTASMAPPAVAAGGYDGDEGVDEVSEYEDDIGLSHEQLAAASAARRDAGKNSAKLSTGGADVELNVSVRGSAGGSVKAGAKAGTAAAATPTAAATPKAAPTPNAPATPAARSPDAAAAKPAAKSGTNTSAGAPTLSAGASAPSAAAATSYAPPAAAPANKPAAKPASAVTPAPPSVPPSGPPRPSARPAALAQTPAKPSASTAAGADAGETKPAASVSVPA